MAWKQLLSFLSTDTFAGKGTTLAAVINNVTADTQTMGGNLDAAGYWVANLGGAVYLAGDLPGTAYTITGGSWAGSVATLTLGAHGIIPGQQIQVAGATPAGYSGSYQVTSTTGTTVSYALSVNPGAWTSGGTVTVGAVAPVTGLSCIDKNFVLRVWNGTSFVFPSGSPGPAGPGYFATTSTSITVATGSMSFTTQTNLAYSPGTNVQLYSTGSGATMTGPVTAYVNTGTSMTVNFTSTTGSGTHSDWNLSLASGTPGSTGPAGYSPVWIVAAGAPSGATGNNDDMYLNSTTEDVYGPKAGGSWGGIVANIKGAMGTGLSFQGNYASGTTYTQGQTVTYSSILYASLVNGNLGNTPSSSPTDWMSLSPGSIAWGSITGTLSSQTDLNSALSGKQASGNYLVDPGSNGLSKRTALNTTAVAGASDLPVFVASGGSHAPGAVPDPGGSAGITKFLREDATWVVPAGGGGGTAAIIAGQATTSGQYIGIDGNNNPYSSPTGCPCPRSGTIANLYVSLNVAPFALATASITVYKNGVATSLAVVIATTAVSGSDTTHSVSVVGGDLITMNYFSNGATNVAYFSLTYA